MANPIFKFVFAAVVTVTILLPAVRPLPVIIESTEFEKSISGNKAKEYVGHNHQLGHHVRRQSTDLPKLVQDLYRNVTAVADNPGKYPPGMTMTYNTVRSFESTISGDCDLTFDIAAIEEREFIFKAEVYLDISYKVDLKIELVHGNVRVATAVNHPSTTSSEMLKFQIGTYLANLLDFDNATNSLLVFTLKAWKVNSNDDTEQEVYCNADNSELVLLQDPTLVVYSYDTKEALLETIQKKLSDSINQPSVLPSTQPTRREADQQPLSCTRSPITVKKEVLNDILEGTYRTIVEPDTFDTGVCDGNCIGNLPQETLHSSILHLLLTSTQNRPAEIQDSENYKRCCAPVKYSEMSMLTILKKPNQKSVYEIKRFIDLSVKECSCIYSRQ